MTEREEAAPAQTIARSLTVQYTTTRSKDHHQSAKAVVALVNAIAKKVCEGKGIGFDPNPQSRCVWCSQNRLHVTARNLDGAIPGLANPTIIWEDKEYWGGTGGSKMSDAVYECNLVGRELREFEEGTKVKVVHIVFVDGLTQWTARKSDLKRFVDLTNQGLIDALLAGQEIETDLEPLLISLLPSAAK